MTTAHRTARDVVGRLSSQTVSTGTVNKTKFNTDVALFRSQKYSQSTAIRIEYLPVNRKKNHFRDATKENKDRRRFLLEILDKLIGKIN